MSDILSLLHLSDLHFGEQSRFQDPDRLGRQLGQAVVQELRDREASEKVDLVIVSGDVAHTAHPVEYGQARSFFQALRDQLGIAPDQVVFTVGNHDVSWTKCQRCDLDLTDGNIEPDDLRSRIDECKFDFFDAFLAGVYGSRRPDLAPTLFSHAHVFEAGDVPLSIALLNSCEIESNRETDHIGQVGAPQAQALLGYWEKQQRDRFRLIVLHHNPMTSAPAVAEWRGWLREQGDEGRIGPDLLARALGDAAGLNGSELLRSVAITSRATGVLHGHCHVTAEDPWSWGDGGSTAVLSAGSLGLKDAKLPREQPNNAKLVVLDSEHEQLRSWSLVFYPTAQSRVDVRPGDFVPDPAQRDGWRCGIAVPGAMKRPIRATCEQDDKGPDLSKFYSEYRERFSGMYTRWDLSIGVSATVDGKPIDASLQEMYVPLRLAPTYAIEDTGSGRTLSGAELLWRTCPLVVTGHAGSGKTTWMRHTFVELLANDRALPVMMELRHLARVWGGSQPLKGDERSVDAYVLNWVGEHLGPGWRADMAAALRAEEGPRPVLLIDGWDELGDLGEELRRKLLGFLRTHERALAIVSSRPYEGHDRPSYSDGFDLECLQPLSDQSHGEGQSGEIWVIADNFFRCVHRGEPARARAERKAFAAALRASPQAQSFARTPLLLTMLLIISRRSRLPEKRHQLYRECVQGLLERSALFEHQVGVLPHRQWRPDDGEECLRVVAELAYHAQGAEYDELTRKAVQFSQQKADGWLPAYWRAGQRSGFLAWLSERAGLLTARADGSLQFAHLSFQEYLAARHMAGTVEGEGPRTEVMLTRARTITWWETLRLWAAQIEAVRPEHLVPVLLSLVESDYHCLAGCMLADDLGDSELLARWAEAISCSMLDGQPFGASVAAAAWAGTRHGARTDTLAHGLDRRARCLNWSAWLRLSDWCSVALNREPAKPVAQSSAGAMLDVCAGQEMDEHAFGISRILAAYWPLWPPGPTGLLNVWPGRRRIGNLLQAIASMDCSLEEVITVAAALLAPPASPTGAYLTASWPRTLAEHWLTYFHHDLAWDLAQQWVLDLARTRAPVMAVSDVSSEWVRLVCGNLARYWSGPGVNLLDRNLLNDVGRTILHSWAATSSRPAIRSSLRRWAGVLGTPAAAAGRVVDGLIVDAGSPGRSGASALLAHLDLNEPAEAMLLSRACKVHCGHASVQQAADSLQRSSSNDVIWEALARHVAGISSQDDRDLLAHLAKHPEERDPPLQWGLQYIVRGDVVLSDGCVVTLDQLAKEIGVDPPPLVEPMSALAFAGRPKSPRTT